MSNSLDPDLGENVLQRLSADDTGRQRVKARSIQIFRYLRLSLDDLRIQNSFFRNLFLILRTKFLFIIKTSQANLLNCLLISKHCVL